jgi:hypothetical protein
MAATVSKPARSASDVSYLSSYFEIIIRTRSRARYGSRRRIAAYGRTVVSCKRPSVKKSGQCAMRRFNQYEHNMGYIY